MCLDNVFDEKFGGSSNSCCILSELSQEVVSNLSETVVALASFNGDRLHVACTGIVVKNDKFGTSVLTSATLVRSLDTDNGCKIIPTLMIEVSLPNNQSAIGWLMHYDLNYNVAVVNISHYPGFRAAHFDHHMQFGSDSKVVALGRCFKTGKLKALSGIVTDEPSGVYREHLMISTCEITVGMTGGALVDLDGNFVGMNFYSKRRTPFLPMDKIYNCLVHSGILWVESEHGGDSTFERSACEIQECSSPFVPYVDDCSSEETDMDQKLSISSTSYPEDSLQLDAPEFVEEELWHFLDPNPLPVDDFTELVRNDLKSRNYPMPIRLEGGMRLVNTFEEEFAEDTWSKLSKKVSSDISRSVVSLASFKGEERFFACTGIFIDFKENTSRVLTSASLVRASSDEYKIADNLKIEVYLPNKQLAVGTLQHYNLSYNVAVVGVKGFRCLRTAKFHKEIQIEPHMEVVAVGRIFESGKLMATGGTVANKKGNLDCKELMISTCKVTKAGIGGPLIDFDGNFIGVNFYGMEETHFLPSKVLERLIRVEGSDVDDASNMKPKRYYLRNKVSNMKQNSWPVPEPRWFYPSRVSCTIETSLNASLTPEPLNFVAKDLSFVLLDSEFMISMPLPNPELVDLVSSDSLVTNVLNLNGETLPCD